jgi:regulator of sigma E protease
MEFLTNTAAFIFVLGLMIFFHEFGHFITAKAFGMRVFVFSFGFGKRLLGFKWGDTDCRVSAIPPGGYVKLEGEPDDVISPDNPDHPVEPGDAVLAGDARDFTARPRWQRFIVYLAGPAMNVVLTIGVLTALYMTGFPVDDASRYDKPIVGAVEPGSPAAAAGLQPGDEILSIDGRAQNTWEDAQTTVLLRPEQPLVLRIRRGGQEQDVPVRAGVMAKEKVGTIGVYPLVRMGEIVKGGAAEAAGLRFDDGVVSIGDRPIRVFGEIPEALKGHAGETLPFRILRGGEMVEIPVTPRDDQGAVRIGVAPKRMGSQFTFVSAVRESWRWTVANVRLTFRALYGLLTAQLSPKTMMGPLGIAQASGDAARQGWAPVFFLVAVISLQIGIMNLFPLPPLDGGHLAILAGESILRRDFSMAVKAGIMNAGALVLFLLIGVVIYSDLSKTSLLGRFLP